MIVIVPLLLISAAFQTADAAVRMQAAMERQRASVRKQIKSSPTAFFTTGWSDTSLPQLGPRVQAPCEPVPAEDLRKIIADAAAKEGINPMLIRAIIDRESGGRACAVSPKGAEGLMQLMPSTSSDLGVRDPFNAADNVSGGAHYLKQMLDRYKGNLRLALAAYNAGPQRVDEANGVPEIPETQAYVAAIMVQMQGITSADMASTH